MKSFIFAFDEKIRWNLYTVKKNYTVKSIKTVWSREKAIILINKEDFRKFRGKNLFPIKSCVEMMKKYIKMKF